MAYSYDSQTTDYTDMNWGNGESWKTKMTFACWVYWEDTETITVAGYLFALGGAGNWIISYHDHQQFPPSSQGIWFRVGSWASEGRWRWPTANSTPTPDTWTHYAIVYDAASTGNNPTLYMDGSVVGGIIEHGTPSGGWTNPNTDYFAGNRSGQSQAWDGAQAQHSAHLGVNLSADEITSMAKGFLPSVMGSGRTNLGVDHPMVGANRNLRVTEATNSGVDIFPHPRVHPRRPPRVGT